MELGSPRLQLLASHPTSQLAKCVQHCAQIYEDLMRLTPLLSAGFQRLHPPPHSRGPVGSICLNPDKSVLSTLRDVSGFFSRRISGWLNAHSAQLEIFNNKLPNEELHATLTYINTPSENRDWVLFLSRQILACKPALPVCFSVKPNMAAFAFNSSRAPEWRIQTGIAEPRPLAPEALGIYDAIVWLTPGGS